MALDPEKIQIILISLLLLFLMGTTLIGLWIFKKFGNPLPRLFFEFDKKIWMTLGLGLFFFGLYFFIISSFSTNIKMKPIFNWFYKYPLEAIYVGLGIFALTTACIYAIRLIIKHLYHNSRKN